jgi:enoyl-CoA hydratase/carnithine racemase
VPNETIEVAVDGAVATITLNRPGIANAISPQMRDELENALAELRPGDRVRVIRVRGAGRSFCSGYDLASGSSVYNAGLSASNVPQPDAGQAAPTELGESSLVLDRERLQDSIERWLRIWNYRKPIVAQVHGACLSGALDLIGVCDLVYAAENARFGHPAARGLGIPPTMGMLPAKIGAARTKELFFTGDTIDGHEALRLGLVNAVVPDAELDERTAALCRRIAHTPLDALTLHKHIINRWSEIAGLRLGALEGADFDAMFHLTPASAMFGRIAGQDGVRAALNWRDKAFGED